MFILQEDRLVTECMILKITGLNVRAYGVLRTHEYEYML